MESSKSAARRILKGAVSVKGTKEAPTPPETPQKIFTLGRDPQLSQYILARALKKPEGVSFTDLVRALLDVKDRGGDKTAKAQLGTIFLHLAFYEETPSDVITLLLPLFQSLAKDQRSLRSLFYLTTIFAGPGTAGTPTLIDPSLSGRRPDPTAVANVTILCRAMLEQPTLDTATKRAAFYLLASAARTNEEARKELISQAQRAMTAADALANAMGSAASANKRRLAAAKPSPSTSQNNWDLQHSVLAAARLSGAGTTGSDDINRACLVGVVSPDPVGARHALALAADLALRDASTVIRQLSQFVHGAADAYEAGLLVSPTTATRASPGQGIPISMEDPFSRMHLARCCAHVVHSDQSFSDVSRDGAPFWRMLCMLATRDEVDMVRFAALEALTGAVSFGQQAQLVAPTVMGSSGARSRGTSAGASSLGARDDAVQQQRRGRAWRLLVSQASMPVTLPGITDATGVMKLIDVVGRLLVLALRKVEGAARFTVAASIIASLAESSLASQSIGTSRHGTSPDVDRVMNILASELDTLIEAPLAPALRSVCIQALLMMQAAGYRTTLTPSKLSQLGGVGKGNASGVGVQDALLAAVLKCAKLKPKEAASFLGYASGVVGMAPAGLDLVKVTELWDATVAAGKEGKRAALAAALGALSSPAPPCTRPGADAKDEEVIQAAKEEDGWNAFIATAIWWLGEHANELCGEFVGQKQTTIPSLASVSQVIDVSNGITHTTTSHEDETPAGILRKNAGRNPALATTISALHSLTLTGPWLLRVASARALSTIAVRSGEPYRVQCYGILAACADVGGRSDALGVQGVVGPVLSLLDSIYASQAALHKLWTEHGDDVEGWPPEVVASLQKRNGELIARAERLVCSVPKERYSVMGLKAVQVLAAASEDTSAYANFLGAEESKVSDRAVGGGDLSSTKNREVEDILSFGGDSDTMSFKFSSTAVDSTVMSDKNKEIESMLTAGAGVLDNPWTVSASSYSSFNAFAEALPSVAAPATNSGNIWDSAPSRTSAAVSPRFGGDVTSHTDTATVGAEVGDGTISPSSWNYTTDQQQQQQESFSSGYQNTIGTARVVGTGTMVHTFVADPQNPEEISVFGGDKVEVLEESDGWMLVRDPAGLQGLVPTSYVQLQALYGNNNNNNPSNTAARGGDYSDRAFAGSPTAPVTTTSGSQHRRVGSIDYFSSKEDYLDRMFAGGDATSPTAGGSASGYGSQLPGMPEEYPFTSTAAAARAGASTSRPISPNPVYRQGSSGFASPTWRGGGAGSSAAAAAASPRTTSPTRLGGGSDLMRQVSLGGGGGGGSAGSGGGNPFNNQPSSLHRRAGSTASAVSHHQRTLSGSSHHRTLSGGSTAEGGLYGSMPGTPSNIEGPERGIVAGFTAEMEGELSVEPGDKVKVHSETGGWARVIRLSDRKVGLVPAWAVGDVY